MPLKMTPGIEVRDEGSSLGRLTIIDLVGAGVSVAETNGVATISILGDAGLGLVNTFTASPQTVQHDALGNPAGSVPDDGWRLLNATAAAAGTSQRSPGILFSSKQWVGGASLDVKSALFQVPLDAVGGATLRFAAMNPNNGLWAAVLDLPQYYQFGLAEGTFYGGMVFNTMAAFKEGVYLTNAPGWGRIPSLSREGGTDVLTIRSTAAGQRVKAYDSAGNYTPFVALEIRASAGTAGAGFSAGFKGAAALAADKTWTLPLVDAAGVMVSDGAGVLSFTGSPTLTGLTTVNANLSGMLEFVEIADPAAPPANNAYVYTRDNGLGKTQLCVRFNTGAVQVLATEP